MQAVQTQEMDLVVLWDPRETRGGPDGSDIAFITYIERQH